MGVCVGGGGGCPRLFVHRPSRPPRPPARPARPRTLGGAGAQIPCQILILHENDPRGRSRPDSDTILHGVAARIVLEGSRRPLGSSKSRVGFWRGFGLQVGPDRRSREGPWGPMGAHGGPMGAHGAPLGPMGHMGPLGPYGALGAPAAGKPVRAVYTGLQFTLCGKEICLVPPCLTGPRW